MFGCNLGTGDYGHITTEHASMLLRNHLSLREYSNQGFEAALLPMTGMVMLHQVSFIFYFFSTLFFYIIIHLNTTVPETNMAVTYLNIVRTKLTTFYRKVRKLIMSFSHCFVIPQMMHSS